jgi:hypothetical protein
VPTRASASQLLFKPTGTNATVDYQQQANVFAAPSDSSSGFIAVQQPSITGFSPCPAQIGDSWNNVANLPVVYPMHSVFNAPNGAQVDSSADSSAFNGEQFSGDAVLPDSHAVVAPQSPVEDSTMAAVAPTASLQQASGPFLGTAVLLQPLQPVFWPVFQNMQISGAAMQQSIMDTSSVDNYVAASEVTEADFQQCDESEVRGSEICVVGRGEKSGQLPSTSGARRQRRSKRAAAERRALEAAALCQDEVDELRRYTEEACLRLRGASEKVLEAEVCDKVPHQKLRWVDTVDDEEEVAIEQIKRLTRSAKLSGPEVIGIDAEEDAQLDANLLLEAGSLDEHSAVEASGDPVILALSNVDSEDFRPTLDRVMGSVWPQATTKNGCRIIQKAIEVGSQADRSRILDQLRGHVHEALKSPHANHVLQKCIEIMPPDLVDFVLIELQGEGAYVARHRFGCRILQRLIEHCSHQQTEGLIAEVLSDASRLCRHQYGNFVIQHILQHGAMAHRHIIAEALCEDTIRLAKHRIASHVLSCAMVHCDSEDVQRLTKVVLDDAGQLADLSRRQYGSFVVREVNRAARMLQA